MNESPSDQRPNWKRLFTFRGRIPRMVFWLVFLCGALCLILGMLGMVSLVENLEEGDPSIPVVGMMGMLWWGTCAWVLLATQVKRWHDVDCSGWMVLINIIPIVGPLVAIGVLGFVGGTKGTNDYGEDPLGRESPPADLEEGAQPGS
ncbi:DUF805 domain-containing protein [Gemmatimonadota bacterium]